MLATNARRILFLAALAVLFLVVRAWLHDAPAPSASRKVLALPPAADVRDAPPAAVTSDPSPTSDGREAWPGTVREAPRSAAAAPLQRAAVRLDVHAPIDVRVGEVFEARIAVAASAPVRDLVFAIAYEKSRLGLIHRSEGEFVRQPGIRAEYGIDEPSEGYVSMVFRAVDGSFATGAGNVVLLEFEALRPGASRIELRNVKSVDAGGEIDPNVIVTHASVTIH
ncbi:MAG TPA: hypothetical protein VJV77_16825 [Casimicrobiaceae bacterium]|nr:hypothetical protein [Casimicrobiaceae bacterium]